MTEETEELYPCVGICMSDPDTGVCMGCGRPPLGSPDVAIEVQPPNREVNRPTTQDPDSPT